MIRLQNRSNQNHVPRTHDPREIASFGTSGCRLGRSSQLTAAAMKPHRRRPGPRLLKDSFLECHVFPVTDVRLVKVWTGIFTVVHREHPILARTHQRLRLPQGVVGHVDVIKAVKARIARSRHGGGKGDRLGSDRPAQTESITCTACGIQATHLSARTISGPVLRTRSARVVTERQTWAIESLGAGVANASRPVLVSATDDRWVTH